MRCKPMRPLRTLGERFTKNSFFFFFLFLTSSCHQNSQEWYYDQINYAGDPYHSKKLYWKAENYFRNLELQITETISGHYTFVNVYRLSFPAEGESPNKTSIHIACGNESRIYYADRLEGGQRLLLSKEAERFIIGNLLVGQTVTISSGRFRSEIAPGNFSKLYSQFVSY